MKNESFHRMLVEGVNMEYRDIDGRIRGAQVRVIDFEDVGANDWGTIYLGNRDQQPLKPSVKRPQQVKHT